MQGHWHGAYSLCGWMVMTKLRIKHYRSADEGEELVAELTFEMGLKECNIGTNSSMGVCFRWRTQHEQMHGDRKVPLCF